MLWGISETVNARAFKSVPLWQHLWKLNSRDYWSSRNKRKPPSKLKHVFRTCSGVSQKWWMLELSNLCHCVQHFPLHVLKTCFSLESGFLSFIELQKSLVVSFQGCWTQRKGFESANFHCFRDTPLHVLNTCCSLESGFLSFLELQKSLQVHFQGCWTWCERLKALAFTISESPHSIFSKHIFAVKVAFFHS